MHVNNCNSKTVCCGLIVEFPDFFMYSGNLSSSVICMLSCAELSCEYWGEC